MLIYILFVVQILVLYFISRITIRELFYVLRWIFKEEKIVFTIISLIFLPGTILHEMSHFLMATILMLRVADITIIPTWEGNYIKLGRVLYEKKDVVRGFLVGIAPVFGGLFFLWAFSYFKLFPQQNIFLNILLVYLIFSVSTSMFSSKQDMIDAIFMLPFLFFIGIAIYLFKIDLVALVKTNESFFNDLGRVLSTINYYALFTICIHVVLVILLTLLRSRKRYA